MLPSSSAPSEICTPSIAIRRFFKEALTIDKLVASGSMPALVAECLEAFVVPAELDPPPARSDLQRQAFRAAFNGADVEAAALYRQLAARGDAPLFELASALAAQGRVRKP